jgi:L-iditol 2-dehydrogenase
VRALRKLAAGPGNVDLVDVPPPAPPPTGFVTLEVSSAGVCGTDLHIRDAEYPSVPPVTMGHEVGGTVVAVGEGADPALLGRRVASETYYDTDGTCRWCRDGRPNLCPGRRSIGTHVDGSFAERVVVPALGVHPVPDHLPDEALSLLEPLACVCNSYGPGRRISAGDRVLVIGPGAVGNLAAQVARAAGAEVVLSGLARDAQRLALAADLGITTSTGSATGIDDSEAFDVVVETSGSAGGWDLAVRAARRGGRILQMGLVGRPVPVDVDTVCNNELTISATFASHPASWLTAMRLAHSRAVELPGLISGVLLLADHEKLFAHIAAGDGVKYVFDPRLDAAARPEAGS